MATTKEANVVKKYMTSGTPSGYVEGTHILVDPTYVDEGSIITYGNNNYVAMGSSAASGSTMILATSSVTGALNQTGITGESIVAVQGVNDSVPDDKTSNAYNLKSASEQSTTVNNNHVNSSGEDSALTGDNANADMSFVNETKKDTTESLKYSSDRSDLGKVVVEHDKQKDDNTADTVAEKKVTESSSSSSGSTVADTVSSDVRGAGVEPEGINEGGILSFAQFAETLEFYKLMNEEYNRDGMATVHSYLTDFLAKFYHQLYYVPNLRNNYTILVKPETLFINPPSCNIIYPNIKSSISYTYPLKQRPTRLIQQTDPMGAMTGQSTPITMLSTAYINEIKTGETRNGLPVYETGVIGVGNLQNRTAPMMNLTKYEKRNGIYCTNTNKGADIYLYLTSRSAEALKAQSNVSLEKEKDRLAQEDAGSSLSESDKAKAYELTDNVQNKKIYYTYNDLEKSTASNAADLKKEWLKIYHQTQAAAAQKAAEYKKQLQEAEAANATTDSTKDAATLAKEKQDNANKDGKTYSIPTIQDSDQTSFGHTLGFLARYDLLRQRYVICQGSVDMYFNPYIVPGFPMASIETNNGGMNIYGYVTNVVHNITDRSWNTTVSFNCGHSDTEASPKAFPIVESEYTDKIASTYADMLGSNVTPVNNTSMKGLIEDYNNTEHYMTTSYSKIWRETPSIEEYLEQVADGASIVYMNGYEYFKNGSSGQFFDEELQARIKKYSEDIMVKGLAMNNDDFR